MSKNPGFRIAKPLYGTSFFFLDSFIRYCTRLIFSIRILLVSLYNKKNL